MPERAQPYPRVARPGGLLSAAIAALVTLLPASFALAQDTVEDWAAELKQEADDADVTLIERLAATRSRAAALGLIDAYQAMQSLYMQREILRALAGFAGVAEVEQPVFEMLANVASGSPHEELREAAIEGLGRSDGLGRYFLERIVDSGVADSVREKALRAHVAKASADDAAWYRFICNFKEQRRRSADGEVQPPELNTIRELAFSGLVEHLTERELVEVLREDTDPKIRRAILTHMHDRGLRRTSSMAKWLLERVDFPGEDRALAARILIEREGPKAAMTFHTLAKKRDVTPDVLRVEMAKLITELDDPELDRRMALLIGRGKPHERVFVLYATQGVDDPRALTAIYKELEAQEEEVRRTAATVLAARGDRNALPHLRKMLAEPKSPGDQVAAIEAISAIEHGSATVLAELRDLTTHAHRDVRNAAIGQFANAEDVRYLSLLKEALQHEDWTTRWIAISGLAALRDKRVVPMLIDRLPVERGRMVVAISDALWNLTGQPFGESAAGWQSWWSTEGAAFEVISLADLEEAERQRERRRLNQRTLSGPRFFGVSIESHRVIFLLDVSGSMLEGLEGRYIDGRPAARIDKAKVELMESIENLEEGALFNIFAFNSGVARWLEGGVAESSSKNRQSALIWLERLGAVGGTNLYDSLALAFEDRDVDTIFVLSDGEPTVGEEIEPSRIRRQVALWNKFRGIKINTIEIGENLEVLQWLAEDSGGSHVHIR